MRLLVGVLALFAAAVVIGLTPRWALGSGETTPVERSASSVRVTYQGRGVVWWAMRAVQARKDANARGRTIRRLRAELASREIGPTLAIRLAFGSYAEQALRVAWCESKLKATAANWTDRHSDGSRGSWGLFQIGSLHRARGESVAAFRARMFDPLANARVAFRLSRGGRSWGPWRHCGRFA